MPDLFLILLGALALMMVAFNLALALAIIKVRQLTAQLEEQGKECDDAIRYYRHLTSSWSVSDLNR